MRWMAQVGSIVSGWVAVDSVPVLICACPEFEEAFFHSRERNVITVALSR